MAEAQDLPTSAPSRDVWRLGVLFATFYAVQGLNEPTEGLLSQPFNTLLSSDLGLSTAVVASYVGWLGMPWTIKPLYGLLSDFVPLFGYHRKSYLLILTGCMAAALAILGCWEGAWHRPHLLFGLMMVPAFCTAFADVVIDAYMVQSSQPLGLVGRMQSVQWTAIYLAAIPAAYVGGQISQHRAYSWGFLTCSAVALVPFVLTAVLVREERVTHIQGDFRRTLHEMIAATLSRAVLPAGVYLLLWHFNPFNSVVLRRYMVDTLLQKESFYGEMRTWQSAGAMVGTFLYGLYCRKVPFRLLAHGAVAFGVASNLFYYWVQDGRTAIIASILDGLSTGTASIMLLDVAAQACPPRVAGTVFAVLMALANWGRNWGIMLGGYLYDRYPVDEVQSGLAFRHLVLIGAAATATCWVVVPWLHSNQGEPDPAEPSLS